MSAFAKVRSAFVERLDSNLEALGVKLVGSHSTGDWRQVICPLCDDTNGSCDVSIQSGHLKCKQCNRNLELFLWIAELRSCTNAWEACQALASDVGVAIEIPKRRGKAPKAMTEEVLLQSVHSLWTSEQAQPCRDFLARRGIADPQILEGMGVGFIAGYITFAQYWPSGQLKQRYRKYAPGAPAHQRWLWSSGRGSTQGLWPIFKPPSDATIVLLEGEWDTLVAWARLHWHKQNIYAYTWTGGVKAIPPGDLLEWVKNRRVDICYDNDTFQGPGEFRAPSDKKRAEMRLRQAAMLETAKGLEMLGCKVRIRAIPVDPAVNWGGDFRDWVEAGGSDWAEVPSWSLAEIQKAGEPKPIETDFGGVYKNAGKRVSFEAVVQTLEEEGITIPIRSSIDCNMGGETYCQRCRAPEKFPGRLIEWKEHPDELVASLLSRDPERVIQKDLLGKPASCSYCRIKPIEYRTGNTWVAVQDDRDEVSDRELVVISEASPALSGGIKIHGSVHHHKKNVVVHASKLEMRESRAVDLAQVAARLHEICPWNSNDLERIEVGMQRRVADLAQHVTHIFGRPDLHIAAELLPHSALWFDVDGHRKRGWLDVAIIGSTSSGKSMTVSNLLDFHGLGKSHTCMENVSRAGLTMGAISHGDRMRLKPGLFPRAHRGMLWLDEFHIMVEEKQEHPMLHLQSARDLGHVGGIKIYGARQLPAAVRFGTISNWMDGRRDSRKFPCQHLLDLYGKPEALRRLDFGLVVDGEPSDEGVAVDHKWHADLEQATILRAWSQSPADVRIGADALKEARQQVEEWSKFYAEELPLFTGAEKLFSLLRIAIAAANYLFSHPKDDLRICDVRPVFVKWAARWLERTWELSLYDQFSSAQFAKREVRQPFHVEAQFTAHLGISDADEALRLLDNFFGTMSLAELSAYTGKDNYKTLAWASHMVRYGAIEKFATKNSYNTLWRLTTGAYKLLRTLLDLAEEFPDVFKHRAKVLSDWVTMGGMTRGNPNLVPLSIALQEKRDEWRNETNVVEGPGS